MLRFLYLSPIGYLISFGLNVLAKFITPFMVYGYWNKPTGNFRKLTRVSSTAVMICKKKINIGENCWIGHHSILDGSNGLKIGEGVQIAGLSGIYSHSSHKAIRLYGKRYIEIPDSKRVGYIRSAVEIGDYSFIGVGAIILPGVVIGRGCIIGAGSVVTSEIPDFSIAVGNPAKITGSTLDMDKKYFGEPRVRQNYFDQEIIRKYQNKKTKSTRK